MRANVYIDGFNLYHAIDDLGQPYLKWLDLWKLSDSIVRGHGRIQDVIYCTAYRDRDAGKKARHRFYIDALRLVGVEPLFGHEANETLECKACTHTWTVKREKATDINLALRLYEDAGNDRFDVAFVISADSDQAATFAFIKARWPQKMLFHVVPPGRELSKHIKAHADGMKTLKEKDIHASIFPRDVTNGIQIVTRPKEYDPIWDQQP